MPLPRSGRAERAAWLRLVLTQGLGPAGVRDLLARFGLPEDVLAAGRSAIAQVVGQPLAGALLAADGVREARVEQCLRWAEAPEHHLLALSDPLYPARLLQIGDPPPLLFVRGRPDRLAAPSIAIVGSRSATDGGCDTAEAFARALAEAGLTVVSGLAEGIDAAAHRGALASPAGTIAVFGTGLDRVYPARHAALAGAIVERGGAVVSELPPGTGPRRASFPRRNRLIAGMSLGVLVVEAALRSGSLITARQAGEFGREVFAIPGSIHAPLARGCHLLIRQGAKLVESAGDVLEELVPLGFEPSRHAPTPGATGARGALRPRPAGATAPGAALHDPPPTAPADSPLLAAVGWDPVGVDTLTDRLLRAGQAPDAGALMAELLALELAQRVERLSDGRYRRTPSG